MEPLPPELEAEREALLREIDEAFDGVARGDGISWSEAVVIDGYGSESERRTARKKDREPNWKALVDDPDWDPDDGVGGFIFLDATGFRYYLAPAMIRYLRGNGGDRLPFALTFSDHCLADSVLSELQTSFDVAQHRCVAHFLRFMAEFDGLRYFRGKEDWEKALAMGWLEPPDPPSSLPSP